MEFHTLECDGDAARKTYQVWSMHILLRQTGGRGKEAAGKRRPGSLGQPLPQPPLQVAMATELARNV